MVLEALLGFPSIETFRFPFSDTAGAQSEMVVKAEVVVPVTLVETCTLCIFVEYAVQCCIESLILAIGVDPLGC